MPSLRLGARTATPPAAADRSAAAGAPPVVFLVKPAPRSMATAGPTLRCAARCASSPLALGAAGDNGIGRSGQPARSAHSHAVQAGEIIRYSN